MILQNYSMENIKRNLDNVMVSNKECKVLQ